MVMRLVLLAVLVEAVITHYFDHHHDITWQEYHEMDCCPHPPPPPPPLPLPPDLSHMWATGYIDTGKAQSRVRIGSGDYTLAPDGAELCCYFPPSVVLLSNVVWEKLKRGEEGKHGGWLQAGQKYSLQNIPGGSNLKLYDITYFDRGIYRCLATGLDIATGDTITVFQDVYFYPSR